MAIPRVFVSSTCYDLKYIRENLRYFIRTLGYEPILSEDGQVFFNPAQHTHDACLTEIPNTQLFVLIIGGRYGGKYRGSENSITNHEYREAIRLKIPVFALVESAVYNEHHLYQRNRLNTEVDLEKLKFPSVDSLKIFQFIDEVRSESVNNALVPFRDFGDMESYLKSQWAGMMFDFLNNKSQAQRVADTLTTLGEMNARIEMLSKQILVSVGTEDAKVDAALYEEMLASEAIRDLSFWKLRPTPAHVLVNETFRACAKSMGLDIRVTKTKGRVMMISSVSSMSKARYIKASTEYSQLRDTLLEKLKTAGISVEKYLRGHAPVIKIEDDVIDADLLGDDDEEDSSGGAEEEPSEN
ncbi:DUF4062 domain-containing protein [Herbaspirillum rubrisubalbicans]|uniref:DUF4062 domain-containing protein n=1 Tax=Herbaspirillum rubrisubalbicans TaxID=80842 RepID=UPI000DD43603|nr:DUF4062 domain-containing protein [Herbaspirillum rubrisubalbicans]